MGFIKDFIRGALIGLNNGIEPDFIKDKKDKKVNRSANAHRLKKVTIYMGHKSAGQLITNFMNPNEIDTMLSKLADPALAQRIKTYSITNKIEQEILNIQVPNITSQAEFAAFVNRAFPETSRPPYADIGVVFGTVLCYFIVAENE